MKGTYHSEFRSDGMPLPRTEQESTSTCMWTAEEMTFSTSDPAHYRKMVKYGAKPSTVSIIDGEAIAWVFKLPANWFTLPHPPWTRKRKTKDDEGEDDDDAE